jgi:hypothetical protein
MDSVAIVWRSSFWNKRKRLGEEYYDRIITFSCSGLSIISPMREPGEVDSFEFSWLSMKNSTWWLPGNGVRTVVV